MLFWGTDTGTSGRAPIGKAKMVQLLHLLTGKKLFFSRNCERERSPSLHGVRAVLLFAVLRLFVRVFLHSVQAFEAPPAEDPAQQPPARLVCVAHSSAANQGNSSRAALPPPAEQFCVLLRLVKSQRTAPPQRVR